MFFRNVFSNVNSQTRSMFFPMFFPRTMKNYMNNMVHVFDRNSNSHAMCLTIDRHECDNVTDGGNETLQIHDRVMGVRFTECRL